jgi:hypothetical protein
MTLHFPNASRNYNPARPIHRPPLCRRCGDSLPRDPPPRGGGYRCARRGAEAQRPDVAKPIIHKLYYGHFFCHVFHQDYIVSKGHNTLELEHRIWTLLNARGAQYPAEHNVGHLYEAKPALINHYKSLDPCNCFNPGIGRTSKYVRWQQGQPNPAPLPQE